MNKRNIQITSFILFFLSLSCAITAQEQQDEGIRFEHITLEQALAKAGETGRKVFIDCYTKTCGPCKMMAKNVFPLKVCGDFFNERFINLMRDMEEGEGIAIAKNYGVRFYPTYLIINADGTLHCSWTGAVPMSKKETFVQKVKDHLELAELNKQYRAGARDSLFMSRYIPLLSVYDKPQLKQVIDETLLKQSVEQWCQPQNWSIIQSEARRVGLPLFRYLFDHRQEFADHKGKEQTEAKLVSVYTDELRTYRELGIDYGQCIADLHTLANEQYRGAAALHYAARICHMATQREAGSEKEIIAMVHNIPSCFPDNQDKITIIQLLNGLESKFGKAEKEEVRNTLQQLLPDLPEKQALIVKRVLARFC